MTEFCHRRRSQLRSTIVRGTVEIPAGAGSGIQYFDESFFDGRLTKRCDIGISLGTVLVANYVLRRFVRTRVRSERHRILPTTIVADTEDNTTDGGK